MYFGTSPQFWLGLQNDYDLEDEKAKIESELSSITPFRDKQEIIAAAPQ